MLLDALPMVLRRVLVYSWGAVFIALVFVAGPQAMMELNEELGWPRWQSGAGRAVGGLLVALGAGLALYCSGVFLILGRGTPVPIDPPVQLVASGVYRFSRNPIYVAYVAVLLGLFLIFGSLALLAYAVLCAAVIQVLIVAWEEPVLRRRFGEEYERYTRQVRRWI